ncbi:MAG: lipopolysaccharide biosynthesis protein [Bacteroidaceae bacterium]|nr:lipopolysaccharide biosynthesis protein [Bacteroidaceae bacterium]
MSDNTEANKRIAKNTMLLYIRMGVMMVISFFTARITLEALGVVDYGINNVVGGLVSMFSLISSSLSSSVSRFMTFGLGKSDKKELNAIFSTSVNIHILLAIIVIIAIETIGVWFLNNKMVIPAERLTAAHWVLQSSTILFAVGLLSVPYNAAIIAHEKMGVYAYFTLFDAFSRLAIIFAIKYYGGDRLILLAIISLIPTLVKQFYYWHYSKKNFEECTYHAVWNKRVFKEMFGFAGWSFIGNSATILKGQGVNIVINMFIGPAINAARGISTQISSIMGQFARNFMIAIDPQITKEYAARNFTRMHSLICAGTRFSYYLLLILSVPLIIETETVLSIWLGKFPEHTIWFARLAIILNLSDLLSDSLDTAQKASGNLKYYEITVSGISIMNLPVSYLLLKFGYAPESTFIASIAISQICLFSRLCFIRKSINLRLRTFIKEVYIKIIIVTLIAFTAPTLCYMTIENQTIRFITVGIVSLISASAAIYFIGCKKEERLLVKKRIHKLFKKKETQ